MQNPIKTLRQQRGLTQRELSLLLDLAAMQVSQYEVGALRPSKRVLKALEELFGVDQEELKKQLDAYYESRKQEIKEKLKVK